MMTIAAIVALLAASLCAASGGVDAARRHRAEHGAAVLEEFASFLALPNVARDRERMGRNAAWIVSAFARRGIRMEALELEGANPIVTGRLDTGSPHTIGIYAHYDGQPVVDERWSSPPWAPTLRTRSIPEGGKVRPLPGAGETIDPEWRLYARSAADDKAPIVAVLAALDALAASGMQPGFNLVFLFEGEEEAGSPNLGAYMETYRARLQADLWLVGDGPVHQSRAPQIIFGVRGVTGLELTAYGPVTHLHSGHYGNWAPNPALELAKLLGSMKDDEGRVAIAGFYDDVTPLSELEQAALATVPDADDALRRELGLGRIEMEGVGLVESIQLPSLNVRGLESGGVGLDTRNVIPSTATASIDIRLVKGNDPAVMLERVEAHVRAQGFTIVREEPTLEQRLEHPRLVLIRHEPGYPAARASMDLPLVQRVVSAAQAAVSDGGAAGPEVVLMPTLGGSLPLYLFESRLGAPAIIVPLANHDNNQHGPDENLRVANLWYGIDVWAAIIASEGSS